MKEALTHRDVRRVVTEITRIEKERAAKLSVDETRELLRELDLPAEYLDEARTAIAERDARAQASRRRLLMVGAGLGAVALLTLGVWQWRAAAHDALAHMGVATAELGVGEAGAQATTFRRAESPELFYRVVLKDAPVGGPLSLACEWLGPDAAPAHENSWQTKPILRALWPTHCKFRVAPGSAKGAWHVRMTQGGRELSNTAFELAD